MQYTKKCLVVIKKPPDAYINKYIQELNEEKDDIDVLYKINKMAI